MQVIPAPKFRHGRHAPPDSVCIHWSAGSGDEVAIGRYFQANPHKEASYGYGIGREGGTAQYVADEDTAWHAGDGESWDGLRRVNDRSIGIVLALLGPVTTAWAAAHPTRAIGGVHRKRSVKARFWEAVTPAQVMALRALLRDLKARHPSIRVLFGHDDVTARKVDPGPILDGLDLGLEALGMSRIVRRWDLPGDPWEGLDAVALAPAAPAPSPVAEVSEPPAPKDAERIEVVANRNAEDLAPAPAAIEPAREEPAPEVQASPPKRQRKAAKPPAN